MGSVHAMHSWHAETSSERPAVGQACCCSRGRGTLRHFGWPSCRLAGRGPACGAAHRRTPIKGSRHVRVRRPAPRGRSARALATRRACSSYSSAAGAPRDLSATICAVVVTVTHGRHASLTRVCHTRPLHASVTRGRHTRSLHTAVTCSRYTRPLHATVTHDRYTRSLHVIVTRGRYMRSSHAGVARRRSRVSLHAGATHSRHTRSLHTVKEEAGVVRRRRWQLRRRTRRSTARYGGIWRT